MRKEEAMADAEPQRLTPALIKSIAGPDLESLDELEIVFSPITEIDGLQRCISLRSLSLINCGLSRISNLWCVRSTLERLCLCQQNLTKIENLDLPNLKELLLQQNQLTQIDNLEGCPKLQRLWLTSNKISRMENLHCLPSLRELWLQDNRITRVAGLDSLVHLERLALAGNPISEFKEVQRLSSLPSLKDVSFCDPHFGACPIIRTEGYWNFALCYLKKVHRVDGRELSSTERDMAEEAYMEQALKFNEKIDQVEREHERAMAEIEDRRQNNVSHADLLRDRLLGAFKELEVVVQEGRDHILREHARQRQLREKNLAKLEEALQSLERAYAEEVDRRMVEEQQQLQEDEEAFRLYNAKIEAERDQALLICRLHYGTSASAQCSQHQDTPSMNTPRGSGVAAQELWIQSADFQYLSTQFADAQGPALPGERWQILRAYRLYNDALARAFSWKTPAGMPSLLVTHVYLSARTDVLFSACSNGPSACSADDSTLLTFVSDPVAALYLEALTNSTSTLPTASTTSPATPSSMSQLLMCRAHLSDVATITVLWDGDFTTLPSVLHAAIAEFPAAAMALQVRYERAGVGDSRAPGAAAPFLLLVRKRAGMCVLPEYHLLCADGFTGGPGLRRVEERMSELSATAVPTSCAEDVLQGLEDALEEEVRRYTENVWEEVEPSTAAQLRAAEEQFREREERLRVLNDEIEAERRAQEGLLRAMRGAAMVTNGQSGSRPVVNKVPLVARRHRPGSASSPY